MSAWQKGHSGNPGGRQTETEEMREARKLAREKSKDAIERLVELMQSENHRVALEACNAVLDRALGKPVTTADVHVSTPGGEFASLPAEQRRQLLRDALAAEEAAESAIAIPSRTTLRSLPAPREPEPEPE